MTEKFLNQARTSELWTAIKTAIATAVTSSGHTTSDDVATAISSALATYSTITGTQAAIAVALANYLTTEEVNGAIATAVAEAANIKFMKVDVLPGVGEPNVIYLLPKAGSAGDVYTEYMWIDGAWETMGSTAVDLSNHWSKDDLNVMSSAELQAILV